jgi:sulfoxide reductase heme-binding subunit YedZ
MTLTTDSKFHRKVVAFNGLLPVLLMGFDAWRGNLGANPVEFATRATGVLCLIALAVTLLVTPLSRIFGWSWLTKQRRLLGLYAFFYGFLHLLIYIAGDRGWQVLTVFEDVYKRPFIAVGMISFLIMVPLAVTSTNAMIKKLGGKRWSQLHKATYLVAIGGVIHYYMIVKSDITYPVFFAIVFAVLLGYRAVVSLRRRA